jgi:hypothetical protein
VHRREEARADRPKISALYRDASLDAAVAAIYGNSRDVASARGRDQLNSPFFSSFSRLPDGSEDALSRSVTSLMSTEKKQKKKKNKSRPTTTCSSDLDDDSFTNFDTNFFNITTISSNLSLSVAKCSFFGVGYCTLLVFGVQVDRRRSTEIQLGSNLDFGKTASRFSLNLTVLAKTDHLFCERHF